MKQYLDALRYCYDNGSDVESRAGGVRKSFGYQMHYDLSRGFPAITTKKLAWKSVVSELLWFIEGSDDERRLAEILYNDSRENLKDKDKKEINRMQNIFGNAMRVHEVRMNTFANSYEAFCK